MGGKTKKKQARKQAATRTKSNGGRNGVSGHMKKSSIGNGKRASDAGEGSSQLPVKKNGKNIHNLKSTDMKRKRDAEDDDEDDDVSNSELEFKSGFGDNSDVRGSTMFTSTDDNDNGSSESKGVVSAKITSACPAASKKKQRLSEGSGSAFRPPSISSFRGLLATKLIRLEDTSFSRLLYPNPVCFLTTINGVNDDGSAGSLNAMTLSWMTPVNNYGGFAFAIHKTRYSAANLLANQKFTLSVPTAQSRDLVLSVGRVSGKVVKKFDGSIPHLTAGTFGYLGPVSSNDISADISSSKNKNKNGFDALYDSDIEEQEDGEEEEASLKIKSTNKAARTSCQIQHIFPPPIDGTIAHMNCTVLSHTDAADAGTYLVIANIHRASVHADYWSSKGKCFISAGVERNSRLSTHLTVPALLAMGNDDTEEPGPVTLPLPPILSFLGSQRFGHLVAE